MASLIANNLILVNLVVILIGVGSTIGLLHKKNYKGIIVVAIMVAVILAMTTGVNSKSAGVLGNVGKDIADTTNQTVTGGNLLN